MKSYDQVAPSAEEIGRIMDMAKAAYTEWRMKHTIEDRRPRELFYSGFYLGYLVGKAQDEVSDNSQR